MRAAAALMTVLVVVGVIVVGTAALYGAGQEQPESLPHPSPSLFHLFNSDDVPHGVNVTVFDANANTNAPLYSETYRLEAGSGATSSIKTNDGGEYRFEISVDGEDPKEHTFNFSRYSFLIISVQMEGAIRTLMAQS
jgi:hypothetical protein